MERREGRAGWRGAALGSLLCLAGTAQAADGGAARADDGGGCAAGGAGPAVVVTGVSERLDVALADGRVLHLAGLDAPVATATSPDLLETARRALAAWLGRGPVTLPGPLSAPDRWGLLVASLVRPAAGPETAAEAMIRAGLGRARPEPGAHPCFAALLAAEGEARAAGRGLWADPAYAVLGPGDADGLAAAAGGMALVQGVLHVHPARGALYLALGRDRRGFVAIVSRKDAARFARAGFDLSDYDGTPVRLRGDLDRRFGPRLRIADPDAVESLEPGSLGEEPDAKHWTARARAR